MAAPRRQSLLPQWVGRVRGGNATETHRFAVARLMSVASGLSVAQLEELLVVARGMVSSPPPPPAPHAVAQGKAAGPASDELEASLTSLSFFARHHPGRLPVPQTPDAGSAPVLVNDTGPVEADEALDTSAVLSRTRPPADDEPEDSPGDLSLSTSFTAVPHCPAGRLLRVHILSNWGDPHFVGANGVQAFDAAGLELPLVVCAEPPSGTPIGALHADPAGVDSLPGFVGDPRSADKLVDGNFCTSNELHTWLAPWRGSATLTVTWHSPIALGCLRLWNYRTGDRAHAGRGLRRVRVTLDGRVVYDGEVGKGGGVSGNILFTMDEAALAAMHASDVQCGLIPGGGAADGLVWRSVRAMEAARPTTSEKAAPPTTAPADALLQEAASLLGSASPAKAMSTADALLAEAAAALRSPPRAAEGYLRRRRHWGGADDAWGATSPLPSLQSPSARARAEAFGVDAGLSVPSSPGPRSPPPPARPSSAPAKRHAGLEVGQPLPHDYPPLPHAQVIDVWIVDTQGDPWYVGLTGVQLLTVRGGVVQAVPLPPSALAACPRDINVDGHVGDDRTLDKLVDGVNLTTQDTHMWLIPYTAPHPRGPALGQGGQVHPGQHLLRIALPASTPLLALRVWNYNKQGEGWQRGARRILLCLDGQPVAPPAASPPTAYASDPCIWLRPAPSSDAWDFAQTLRLAAGPALLPEAPALDLAATGVAAAWEGCARGLPAKGLSASLAASCVVGCFPMTSLVQLKVLGSCGDAYYVGLDALTLLDAAGTAVPLPTVQATPTAASFPGCAGDIRHVSNLGREEQQPWLGQRSAHEEVTLHVALQAPVVLGAIVLKNYSKSPARGVGSLEVWLDGCQVLTCTALPTPHTAQAMLFAPPETMKGLPHDAIVLTSASASAMAAPATTVACVNDGVVLEAPAPMKTLPAARPATALLQ